jgi:Zn-dependent M28 family amino/carboxypeptidase
VAKAAEEVVRAVASGVSDHRAMRVLASLTAYNRVQGTIDLVDAAKHVQEVLLEEAGDSLEVELVKFGGTNVPDWVPSPTGWAVHRAYVKAEGGGELTLEAHPTLVAAHSPPSGGEVSGEPLTVDREWWRPESYSNAKGKVVVSPGDPYIVYRLASEAGAAAVALYSESAPPEAVPYKSLFLSRTEAANSTVPAVSIPRGLVEALRAGRRLSLLVDSDVRRDPGFPIVVAWVGDKDGKGPAAMAHICHPTPGANDNGSGSAALTEAAIALSRLIDSGALEQPPWTVRFIWVPEYTGSSVALTKTVKGQVTQLLNFDMVGAEPGGGNGPLRVVASSLSALGQADAALMEASRLASELLGFDSLRLVPYDGGSDHDVASALGIPSAMLNGWPDVNYHTDLDDLDSVSRRMLRLSSAIAASSIYLLSASPPDPAGFRGELLSSVVRGHLLRGDPTAAALARSFMARALGIEGSQGAPEGWPPKADVTVKSRPPMIEGPRVIARRSLDAALRVAQLLAESGPGAATVYLREGMFLAIPERTLGEVASLLAAEYGTGSVSVDRLLELFNLLADIKMVELG